MYGIKVFAYFKLSGLLHCSTRNVDIVSYEFVCSEKNMNRNEIRFRNYFRNSVEKCDFCQCILSYERQSAQQIPTRPLTTITLELALIKWLAETIFMIHSMKITKNSILIKWRFRLYQKFIDSRVLSITSLCRKAKFNAVLSDSPFQNCIF